MSTNAIIAEFKWILLSFVIAIILVYTFSDRMLFSNSSLGNEPTILHLFTELIVFCVFGTFVVFGIKGFFEKFSHKFANVIIFITGVILTVVIFTLSYQILSLP